MKVLYGDDKATWHQLIEKVLSSRLVEVIHAYTPRDVINLANKEKPDVVLLDYTLRNGTALDVLEDLKRTGCPVIVTGYKLEGFDPEKAKAKGAVDTLEKPFTVEELISKLQKAGKEKPAVEEKLELVLPSSGEVLTLPTEEPEIVSSEETVSPQELPVINLEETAESAQQEIIPIEPSETAEEPIILEPVQQEATPTETPISSQESIPLEPQPLPVESEEAEKPAPQPVERVAEEAKEAISKAQVTPSLPDEKVEEIIREIAWEVIPEIAERVIKEEVEKLIKSRLA